MNTNQEPRLPLVEVTRRAMELLYRELGPADAIRFIKQFTSGSGDYTAEREKLFDGLSVAQLAAEIRKTAAGSGEPPQAMK